MSVTDLDDTLDARASDAGAVAARQGFKYQDQVAAFFILTMFEDERLKSVECETADDVLLNWEDGSGSYPEYVQVKTTEEDHKWTVSEVTSRDIAKTPTSLIEKSLLCDKHGPNALFRIVSRRDVVKGLSCLKRERGSRSRSGPAAELGKNFTKKFKTTWPVGNDLAYWAQQAVWQVTGDVAALAAMNHKKLSIWQSASEQIQPPHTLTRYTWTCCVSWMRLPAHRA
jgi:Cap4-like dsDNA endonuclease family protein